MLGQMRLVSAAFSMFLLAVAPALAQGIPVQPGPETVPPTDIATGTADPSDTSAVVLGYFNYGATNPPGIAKECWFEYGTTLGFGRRENAICSGTTKATLSPLVPGTTYYYIAAAGNEAGTTYGPYARSFTTPGTPPPSPGPPPPGSTGAKLKVVSGQSLGSVLRRGLRLRVTVFEPCPCTVRAKLLVSTSTARRLGLGRSRSIALSRTELGAASVTEVALKPKRSVKRKLRRTRLLKVTARVTVTRSSGRPSVVSRAQRLKRR
jgi:hypothetical protein